MKEIYQLFGFQYCVRIDFILEEATGIPYFLEINTQPGMTETSDIPKMLKEGSFTVLSFVEALLLKAFQ